MKSDRTPEQRFWDNVSVQPEGCWEWVGGKATSGYGVMYVGGEMVTAHRMSWRVNVGEIPRGMWVLHKCDNRPCVRPDHLYLGSQTENMADCVNRGRYAGGERHVPHKLTESEVREIISLRGKEPQTITSKRFGVDQSVVSDIQTRKTWKRVAV